MAASRHRGAAIFILPLLDQRRGGGASDPGRCIATCGGTIWTGTGTDATGFIRLGNSITVASGQNVVFTYMGTATAAATYTVTNPRDLRTMSVAVTPAGRVSVGP